MGEGAHDSRGERATLGRTATLAAWLGLWTPPEGVVVRSPSPWRLALVGGALLVALIAGLAAIASRVEAGKRDDARRRAHDGADLVARERARLHTDGRLHTAPLRSPLSPTALVAGLQRAISGEERRRAGGGRVARTRCRPHGAPDQLPIALNRAVTRTGFDCVLRSRSARGPAGADEPLWARVDLSHGRYLWCVLNGALAQGVVGDELARADLPPVCDLDR